MALLATTHPEGPSYRRPCDAKPVAGMEICTQQHSIPGLYLTVIRFAQHWVENLTGTRGAFKTYNTAAPKLTAWEPKVVSRPGPSQ